MNEKIMIPDKEEIIKLFDNEYFTDFIEAYAVLNNKDYDIIIRGTNMWTKDLLYEICKITESNVINCFADCVNKTWLCTFKKINKNE